MNNQLLTKLTKQQILSLPGFQNQNTMSLAQLRTQLRTNMRNMNLKYGARINDYVNGFKKTDDELFNRMKQMKNEQKMKHITNEQYKQHIKQNAIEERQMMNDVNDVYHESKSDERKAYEQRVSDVKDKKQYKEYMKQFIYNTNNEISFEIDIGDDEDKRIAFTEMLRYIYSHKTTTRPVVKAYSLDGSYKWFTLSNKFNMDSTIGHIAGTIDLNTDESDMNPYIDNVFAPVRYEILFIDKSTNNKTSKFKIKKQSPSSNKIYDEEIELDEDFRDSKDGSFFPYINLSNIDLTDYQIFNSFDKNNYNDNCFVYACIKSEVFTKQEIQHLRYCVMTKSIPNDKIINIAKQFKCHFIITRIDERKPVCRQQIMQINTTKKSWAKDYKRTVRLLLYKEHYMINKPIDGKPLITVLRNMFRDGQFEEIKACEKNILSSTEYNHLNDYEDLEYDDKLCLKPIKRGQKEAKQWTEIYFSDYESNVNVSPHVPYLNCTVHRDNEKIISMSFIGDDISNQLLDYLADGSLTYFHNLKYDSCFFINTPGWNVKLIERSGTILQLVMMKYDDGKLIKTLTFRDSYSLIPAPLRDFATMFKLNVHKEVMAYKLYNERNIKRNIVSALEFQIQYFNEQRDKKSFNEIKNDWQQLITNSQIANAYNDKQLTIDIMKYAKFYCKKDCIVLMKGIEKFNNDLQTVFNKTKTKMFNVHQYISISSIGYQFALNYGCFDGCYELSGKPQNFIQRCVSGGRTMTANNEKQYIEGNIQDFDAVSLYPSAMHVMNGVPKGKPKIIPSNITTNELLSYDTFFIEINITNIKCKSSRPYRFGQVFKYNDAGSKIFCNECVQHYYLDKREFEDLIEFYDFDYEFIRGYYFNDGFNNKINVFIEKLFKLREQYKRDHNPLEKTIKLLLNSIYGKSILKAITTETKCVPRNKIIGYIWKHYNYIREVVDNENINNVYVKRIKPINNHFNLPQFGASVLSWSKYLMNRVIGTAEQHNINVYYQDCDSLHIFNDDIEKLAKIYKLKYGKDLIGKNMTQYHCDFDSFDGAVGAIHSRKLIALGKKSYLDILVDEQGHEGYHIRMKGIPKQVILNKCKRMNITVEELYERMYHGESITFNLLDGCNCFKKTKSYQQTNLNQFSRTVKF